MSARPDIRLDSYQLTCVTLLLLMATVLVWRRSEQELQEQLRLERDRRRRLTEELTKRDQQMDGALDEINRLKADPAIEEDEPA